MATLVKIRGLDRGAQAVGGDLVSRGFRIRTTFTRSDAGVKAFRSIGAGNANVTYTAKYGGTYGNSIKVAQVDPGANNALLNVVTTYDSSGNPTVTVNLATGAGGAITSTALQVKNAVNADAGASQWVTASNSGTGATVVAAAGNSALTSGTTTGIAGERIKVLVNNKTTVVVDVDDPYVSRILKRNAYRYVSLGAA
jgi:hypothetical protein